MRVILDTSILISALLVQSGTPGTIYRAWTEGGFTLLTADVQMAELSATLRKPALASRIRPHHAGRLLNTLRRFAETIGPLPRVVRSPDPEDDFCWRWPRPDRRIISRPPIPRPAQGDAHHHSQELRRPGDTVEARSQLYQTRQAAQSL